MVVSHGRGGVERIGRVKLGNVVEDVIERAPCPVFMVSAVSDPVPASVAATPEPAPNSA